MIDLQGGFGNLDQLGYNILCVLILHVVVLIADDLILLLLEGDDLLLLLVGDDLTLLLLLVAEVGDGNSSIRHRKADQYRYL